MNSAQLLSPSQREAERRRFETMQTEKQEDKPVNYTQRQINKSLKAYSFLVITGLFTVVFPPVAYALFAYIIIFGLVALMSGKDLLRGKRAEFLDGLIAKGNIRLTDEEITFLEDLKRKDCL